MRVRSRFGAGASVMPSSWRGNGRSGHDQHRQPSSPRAVRARRTSRARSRSFVAIAAARSNSAAASSPRPSLLSLGDGGWVQVANFIVAGVLMLAFAVGVRRSLTVGPGRRAAPILFAIYGIGLVLGGAFPPDPALGFPAGTPDGYPTEWTVPGTVHAFAPPLAFLAIVVVTFVVARRLAWEGHRAAAIWSRVIGIVCLLLCQPLAPVPSLSLFLGVALAFAWITGYAVSLLRSCGAA